MNRKMRRAAASGKAREPEGAVGSAKPDDITQLFQVASAHQREGRLADAARIYDRILTVDPVHADSLQNLGVIAMAAGKYEMATGLFRRALELNEQSADLHYNMATSLYRLGSSEDAIAHASRALALKSNYVGARIVLGDALNRQGKRDEAFTCYARAVADAPDNPQANAKLAVLLSGKGRFAEARQHFERALAREPNNAGTHLNFGNLYYEQGDLEQAIACYLRAMEIKPDYLDAHANFCVALLGLSKYDAVIAYYEQLLEVEPKFTPAYNLLASAYNAAGDTPRALELARRGLAIAETDGGRAAFTYCLRSLKTVPAANLRDLIVRAATERWSRPNELVRHLTALISATPPINEYVERAVSAWPEHLSADQLFGPTGLQATSNDSVLRALLEHSRVGSLALEQFLTVVRFGLLEAAASHGDTPVDQQLLAFYCALARQCFINEYVFLHTEQEIARVHHMREALDVALRGNAPVSPLQLAAIAAYVPLHSLTEHARLLDRSWPQPIDALITQQVREPAEEKRLRDTIPALTPIEDAVSIAVRNQYEENPYPRWIEPPAISKPVAINQYLRTLFPRAEFRHPRNEGPVYILFAGCGTGQNIVDFANRIADARMLAVDLSLTSMAYAKRKMQSIGLQNVDFGQADILKLGSLGRTFDVIACGGVLHHLADPDAGWRVLLSLLAPNGFMKIGLYSETARVDYVATQKWIAERGYGRSPDEIRRFRRDFIAGEKSRAYYSVLGCRDFYSISECRDLLFHVQEHRLTIPQLAEFFAANDLQFLGFEIDKPVQQRYAGRFPDDPAATNLANWHVFEQENPKTFAGMYQFWVQKGRAAV
jgi:tetratricopeptide (TPR) repeat protein/SAM-dependent methyltransferase